MRLFLTHAFFIKQVCLISWLSQLLIFQFSMLSRILKFIYSGSNNSNKKGGGKSLLSYFFFVTKIFTKFKIIILNSYAKNLSQYIDKEL